MNKKGQFFFFQWGTDVRQEQIFGVNLNFKCPCKSKTFNLTFNLERHHIFWFIPISSWAISNAYIQCPQCGRIWELEGRDDKLQDLYAELKAKQELPMEDKITPSNKKQVFNLTTTPLFTEFSEKKLSPKEKEKKQKELKLSEEEAHKEFIRFLKGLGIFVGIVALLILIWKFIIT